MHTIFSEGPDPTKHVTYKNSSNVGGIVGIPSIVITAYEIPIVTLLFLLIDDSKNIVCASILYDDNSIVSWFGSKRTYDI